MQNVQMPSGNAGNSHMETTGTENTAAMTDSAENVRNPYNPNDEVLKSEFVKNLIQNFDDSVIKFLDHSARAAIIQQKEIEEEKEFTRIKVAVEERVLHLLNESQLRNLPSVGYFRQLVSVLAAKYPYMFLDDPKVTVQGMTIRRFNGRGAGGSTGIRSLPKALQQKFAKLRNDKDGVVRQTKKRDLPDDAQKPPVPKKKKKVYGIRSERYYVETSEDLELFREEIESLPSTEEKEAKFSAHRAEVQKLVRSKTDPFSAVPGFFEALCHAESHFEWLTGQNLAKNIETELPRQFRLIKSVVEKLCVSKDFVLSMKRASLKGVELNGSYVPEFICLLRQLTFEWHKTQGGLLRFPGEPESASPNILCVDGPASVAFDVHAEYKKVFSQLNLCEALRAFFSIAFVCNLEYPADGEAVAILLQRKVAGIDAEGM
jgi:hypothetical protein